MRDSILICSLTAVGGCAESKRKSRQINLGPVAQVPEGETVRPLERLVIRREGGTIRVMSILCTHQACVVNRSERGFYCPCHGSLFDADGRVQTGPATRDLRWFETAVSADGSLVVDLSREVDAHFRLPLPGQTGED